MAAKEKPEPLRLVTVRLFARDIEYLQRRYPRGKAGWKRRKRGGEKHGEGGYNEWVRELVRWAIERDRWVRKGQEQAGEPRRKEESE